MKEIEKNTIKKPRRNLLAEKYEKQVNELEQKLDDSRNVSSTYEKQIYDLKQLLEISKSLCSSLEYSTLTESILYVCMAQMRVIGAGMFVFKSFDSDVFTLDSNYSGVNPDPSISYSISVEHPIIKFFNDKDKAFTLEELQSQLPASEIPEQFVSLSPSLIVPLKQKRKINGVLLLGERIDLGEGVEFSDYERQQILMIATLSSIAINNATLLEMTTTDMMTHLKLKHYFYNVLSEKLDFSMLNKLPLAVMMLDIDFFKKFNDTYGHACGDYVLQRVSQTISDGIRTQDIAGRYGGEEFVVMLYNTDISSAQMVAERIRRNIEKDELVYENNKMHVTISIGVSVYAPEQEMTARQLVEMADQALYVSKRTGRNRVTLADSETLQSVKQSVSK